MSPCPESTGDAVLTYNWGSYLQKLISISVLVAQGRSPRVKLLKINLLIQARVLLVLNPGMLLLVSQVAENQAATVLENKTG